MTTIALTDMRDGMRVRTTKDLDLWVGDWHFVSTLARTKGLLIDFEDSSVQSWSHSLAHDNAVALHLGYKAETGGIQIPRGSLGNVRLLDTHTLSHKRDKPGHVLGFPSNYWFSEEVVPAGTEAPENFLSVSRWYALELDNWDITGNEHGYLRGLKLVHIPLVNGYTSVIPDSVDHPDYELPEYLEEIYD